MSESRAQVFARLMAVCERGFDNEHAWRAWWKAHHAEIKALPPTLGDRVRLAWDQATAKEFSTRQPRAAPSKTNESQVPAPSGNPATDTKGNQNASDSRD